MSNQTKRVVVVDDSDYSRARMVELVEGLGYEVVGEGKDGEEGLKLAQEHQPDLVLTDYAMPNMTGPQLVSQTDIPTIIITTDLTEYDVIHGRDMGAVATLDKSDRKTIIAAIKKVLGDED